MSLEGHIVELRQKHKTLEAQIHQEMSHPNADDLRITELKRKKLKIKDELTRLGGTQH